MKHRDKGQRLNLKQITCKVGIFNDQNQRKREGNKDKQENDLITKINEEVLI